MGFGQLNDEVDSVCVCLLERLGLGCNLKDG